MASGPSTHHMFAYYSMPKIPLPVILSNVPIILFSLSNILINFKDEHMNRIQVQHSLPFFFTHYQNSTTDQLSCFFFILSYKI